MFGLMIDPRDRHRDFTVNNILGLLHTGAKMANMTYLH